MIEVEKKFRVSDKDIEHLVDGADYVKEKTIVDTYYDTPGYTLTAREWWLRERNGRFELKVSLEHKGDGMPCEFFDEIETDEEIYEKLGIDSTGAGLGEDLHSAGYAPFAVLTTQRKTYRSGDFTIDIDETTGARDGIPEGQTYVNKLAEIELMVSGQEEIAKAAKSISEFAKSKKLDTSFVNGKLLEFIKQANPPQYAILVAEGRASA